MIDSVSTARVWVPVLIFLVAIVYSSVGHGGASGYLAVLSFLNLPSEQMATAALMLNIFVAGIGLRAFSRAGYFSTRLTWPFLIGSIPGAFLGGLSIVSNHLYSVLLAVSLSVAAWRLWQNRAYVPGGVARTPSLVMAVAIGVILGWLSGVVGVGGGIFLSPLLLFFGWASPQQSAASSSCFILFNSISGLAGRFAQGALYVGQPRFLLVAACAGGLIGSLPWDEPAEH